MSFASFSRAAALAAIMLPTMLAPVVATAQEQQAGNEASTNAEETFQALIAQCDDTEILFLRARIRLQIGRAAPEAAAQAQKDLDEGLALCGQGDIATAKTKLEASLETAQKSVEEAFGQDGGAEVAQTEPEGANNAQASVGDAEETPSWIWMAVAAGLIVVAGGYFMSRKSS